MKLYIELYLKVDLLGTGAVTSQISWGPFDRFGPGALNFNPPGPTPRP